MSKFIDTDKLMAEIERRIGICKRVTGDERNEEDMKRYYQGKVVALEEIRHLATSLQQEQPEVSVECYVRVYPTLDNKPRPWVSLCKHGISCNSIRDIPELENLGFKDDDTAIVTIKKK